MKALALAALTVISPTDHVHFGTPKSGGITLIGKYLLDVEVAGSTVLFIDAGGCKSGLYTAATASQADVARALAEVKRLKFCELPPTAKVAHPLPASETAIQRPVFGEAHLYKNGVDQGPLVPPVPNRVKPDPNDDITFYPTSSVVTASTITAQPPHTLTFSISGVGKVLEVYPDATYKCLKTNAKMPSGMDGGPGDMMYAFYVGMCGSERKK